MTELTLEYKKIWVQGLLIACPIGKPLENCPANNARDLPINERLDLVTAMNGSQLDQIIDHHQKCLHRREYPTLNRNG